MQKTPQIHKYVTPQGIFSTCRVIDPFVAQAQLLLNKLTFYTFLHLFIDLSIKPLSFIRLLAYSQCPKPTFSQLGPKLHRFFQFLSKKVFLMLGGQQIHTLLIQSIDELGSK